ncbi:MAG: hypothetical protein ACYDH5_12515 [Acidimicrobiales bacterium]
MESWRLETERQWVAVETAYVRMQREDPVARQGYLAELGELTAVEPDATAAEG